MLSMVFVISDINSGFNDSLSLLSNKWLIYGHEDHCFTVMLSLSTQTLMEFSSLLILFRSSDNLCYFCFYDFWKKRL